MRTLCMLGCVVVLVAHPAWASSPEDVAGWGAKAGDGALARLSGGTQVVSTMTLQGTVSNNSDENVATGFNSIASGSLSGAAGVPMVIQNSGNNVLIQNATIINVQFQP